MRVETVRSQQRTVDFILAALKDSRAGGSIVAADDQRGRVRSYREFAEEALRVAGALRDHGIEKGSVVFVGLPMPVECMIAFCGVVLAGAIPCCIPAGARGQSERGVLNNIVAAWSKIRPAILITTPDFGELLSRTRELNGARVVAFETLTAADPLDPARVHVAAADETHHLQLTSGSTGLPKAAVITHRNVVSNIAGIIDAAGLRPGEVYVSWLPLFHDMGLISVMAALFLRSDVILQSPGSFLRNPLGWLRNISDYGGTATAAPNFGLAYCVRRFRAAALTGVDLRTWRVAFIGGERVHHRTLIDFHRCFQSYGFSPDTFFPCYGAGEATLAITIPRGKRTAHSQWGSNIVCDYVVPGEADETGASRPPASDRNANREPVLSMGPVIEGLELVVTDDDGNVLPERAEGEICIRGASVMREYYNDAHATAAVMRDGWYRSGDLGYISNENVFVIGRKKELIILRGRNYYPHEFEDCVESHPQVERGQSVAFGVFDEVNGTEYLVVMLRPTVVDGLDKLHAELQVRLRERFGFGAQDIAFLCRGALPRTTSGKLRRLECRRLYRAGALDRLPLQPARAALAAND